MKRTENVNIGGLLFYVDEDAYTELKNYIDKIEKWFASKEGGADVVQDIELRIAEILTSLTSSGRFTVSSHMVANVIATVGQPEQFDSYEEPGHESKEAAQPASVKTGRKLYRDKFNSVFGGVCAGLAAYFGIDVLIVRILFVIFGLSSLGMVLLVYIVLMIIIPEAVTPAQRLEMCGEPVNFANISKEVGDGFNKSREEIKEGRLSPQGWALLVIAILVILTLVRPFVPWIALPSFIPVLSWHGSVEGVGIGILLMAAGFFVKSRWRIVLFVAGGIILLTNFIGWLFHLWNWAFHITF